MPTLTILGGAVIAEMEQPGIGLNHGPDEYYEDPGFHCFLVEYGAGGSFQLTGKVTGSNVEEELLKGTTTASSYFANYFAIYIEQSAAFTVDYVAPSLLSAVGLPGMYGTKGVYATRLDSDFDRTSVHLTIELEPVPEPSFLVPLGVSLTAIACWPMRPRAQP